MTNTTNAPKSFPSACMAYFGKHPGQTMQEFANEIKRLTDADRAELRPLLAAELGCEVI